MQTLNRQPKLIAGGLAVDERGVLSFVNDFDFQDVKRFYVVENFSLNTVRAWHGHLKEAKYAFVPQGSAIVAAVEMDDIQFPNKNNQVQHFVLSAKKPGVLYIPPGFANGFRVLEKNTKIIFFSTATLEESKDDDYRFPIDYWGLDVWRVKSG